MEWLKVMKKSITVIVHGPSIDASRLPTLAIRIHHRKIRTAENRFHSRALPNYGSLPPISPSSADQTSSAPSAMQIFVAATEVAPAGLRLYVQEAGDVGQSVSAARRTRQRVPVLFSFSDVRDHHGSTPPAPVHLCDRGSVVTRYPRSAFIFFAT